MKPSCFSSPIYYFRPEGHFREITTVILNVNERDTTFVLGPRNITLFGPGHIEDVLCGKRFILSPGSFYQVNSVQTEVLYRKAIKLAGLKGTETVIDAYCGMAQSKPLKPR